MKNIERFKDKKVLIVGMGRSGIAAADAMLAAGACIYLQDSKAYDELPDNVKQLADREGVTGLFGETPSADEGFDIVILSPGVPPALGFIKEIEAAGAHIMGELELAYLIADGQFIAITGTNGKTTTTTLVGEIFKASGRSTCVGGNIGNAIVAEVMSAEPDTWFVAEVSSFQLETIHEFHPKVSALLNLTPDHLDRHGSMAGYAAAKARVFENQEQSDYFITNYEDEMCMEKAQTCSAGVVPFSSKRTLEAGAFVQDDKIVIKKQDGSIVEIMDLADLKIPGEHNLENALAAAAVCYYAGISPEVIAQAASAFEGVEHRIENCGSINGVRFVNDSKGTNPDAAIKALQAMEKNIILIAGGYDKGASYEEFIGACKGRVKHMMLMGKTAGKIAACADEMEFSAYTMCEDMGDCIRKGFDIAEEGDVILLSPACASWDMYPNFETRGEHFKECMNDLRKELEQA